MSPTGDVARAEAKTQAKNGTSALALALASSFDSRVLSMLVYNGEGVQTLVQSAGLRTPILMHRKKSWQAGQPW
jgi:hypothetical protein